MWSYFISINIKKYSLLIHTVQVPVCFVPVRGQEERTGSSGDESAHSLRNPSEAQQVGRAGKNSAVLCFAFSLSQACTGCLNPFNSLSPHGCSNIMMIVFGVSQQILQRLEVSAEK